MAAVDALLARSYPRLLKPDYPPSVLVTALPIISRARPELLASGTYFLAEAEDGAVIGAGGWTRDRRNARVGHIRHLVTDHRKVRKGVGRALMNHIFETAKAGGIAGLECQATRTAVPFYRAMGFATVRDIKVDLRPGIVFPAVLMRRRLATG
jgi:GNAT superfamily N-acetyltransferase